MNILKQIAYQLNDKLFLERDISRLQITIKAYETTLENMRSQLRHLQSKKSKNEMTKR